ncbi:MAG: ABC transporter permease [Deltaproteobacteria bacterium]|nr:ABC transporter permease [Deltaproteobacteria bacterium]
MTLLGLALRNLRRHLRRTVITGAAIGLGLAMLIVWVGIADGAHGQMIDSGVGALAGHVVVQGAGWQKTRRAEIAVPGTPALRRQIAKLVPGATLVPRVFVQGLLSSPTGSVGVALSAVEPALECRVNEICDYVVEGRHLDGARRGMVLGQALARKLHVGVGDKVVLMAQSSGAIQSRLFRVSGLFRLGVDEIDGFYAQIQLADGQELLGLGDDVTQLALHLADARQTDRALAALRRALPASVEVLPWREALPQLYEFVLLDDAGLYLFAAIIGVIIAIGIMNTVLMSVLERLRELGVLLALGMSPRRLFALVLTEAALLGVTAAAVGAGLGLLGHWPLAVYGLDYSALAGETMEAGGAVLRTRIFSHLVAWKVVLFAAAAVGVTVAAAIYPALKATRLRPVQCLQHR